MVTQILALQDRDLAVKLVADREQMARQVSKDDAQHSQEFHG